MLSERIQFPANGGQAPGFLARPQAADKRPAVVVIQEWWGLNAHIQDVTRRFATAGFVALAPDLYHGKVATEPDEARKAVMEMNRDVAVRDIRAGIDYLKSLSDVAPKRVGMVGFCMGGGVALQATATLPDVAAVVAFYGSGPDAGVFAGSSAAILSIVGDQDERAVASNRALHAGLDAQGYAGPHELVVYPGAAHAFFNDTRAEVYDADASNDAWARTLSWLRANLT